MLAERTPYIEKAYEKLQVLSRDREKRLEKRKRNSLQKQRHTSGAAFRLPEETASGTCKVIFEQFLCSFMFFFILLQGPRELIRAGSGAEAAVYAFRTGDHLVDIHAFHEPGYALCVAGAAADKADILQFIVFHFKADFTGTDALCLKIHNLLPPDDSFYKWICKYNIPHLFIK